VQQKIKGADYIVANSNFVRKEIEQNLDIYNKPISTIYSGSITLQNINDKKPGFIDGEDFLFTVGTIARKKNFHVLPALLQGNNLKLIVAGIVHEEDYRNKIIETARQLGVADRVILPGPVTEEEKYWLIKNCTAFCFPSIAEGYGLPVIEAMHFGKPCIISTYTSLPEVGGPHAFYMQNFEPSFLKNLAADILHDIAANNKASELKAWASQFSWQKTAAKYMDVYRNVY
jgi:glycosyltransferase involved in cell wall biosynthesis